MPYSHGHKNGAVTKSKNFITAPYFIEISLKFLLPVPIYRTDKVRKGYCHTEKICREITELTGIPTVTAVAKIKKTAQQKSLGREKRLVNLKGCFAVTDENALKDKHVLVIDDVTTTGSTLAEIYHTIEKCDPAAVDFAVFART